MEAGRRGRYTGREVAQSGSRAGGCRYRCLELCSARVAMAERAPDPRASPWSNAYHANYYGTPRDADVLHAVHAASITTSLYVRWPPGLSSAGTRQTSSASSESQTVRSPRRRMPASYSDQVRIRSRDFACLYLLRFGYFIGGGSEMFCPHQVAKPRAMHQGHRTA